MKTHGWSFLALLLPPLPTLGLCKANRKGYFTPATSSCSPTWKGNHTTPTPTPTLETILLREREAWKVRGHRSESQLCHEDGSPRSPTSPACSGNSNLSKEDCSDLDQRRTHPQCPAQRLHISRDPNCYVCAQDCDSDLKQPRAKLGRGQFVFRAAGTYISVSSLPLWAPHSQEPTLSRISISVVPNTPVFWPNFSASCLLNTLTLV